MWRPGLFLFSSGLAVGLPAVKSIEELRSLLASTNTVLEVELPTTLELGGEALEIPVGTSVRLRSADPVALATLDAVRQSRIFDVYGSLHLERVEMRNGVGQHESLPMFSNAPARAAGGIIVHSGGSATLVQSAIVNCNAVADPGPYPMFQEQMQPPFPFAVGGGLVVREGGEATLRSSSISGCSASSPTEFAYGGCVALERSLQGNSGGGIVHMVDSTLSGCTAVSGGGIAVGEGARARLVRTTISDSNATSEASIGHPPKPSGGAIGLRNSASLDLIASTIQRCRAQSDSLETYGGGVAGDGKGRIVIRDSHILECVASTTSAHKSAHGGGLSFDKGDLVEVSNTTIAQCSATTDGGGLFIDQVHGAPLMLP